MMAAAAATDTGFGLLADPDKAVSHRKKTKKHSQSSHRTLVRKELVLPWFISSAEGQEFVWADCLGDGMDDFHRKRICGTYTPQIAVGSVDQVEITEDPVEAEVNNVPSDGPAKMNRGRDNVETQAAAQPRAKTPEKTLSKKQKKQQEMEELDAILNEMGIEPTASQQEAAHEQTEENTEPSTSSVPKEEATGAEIESAAAKKKRKNKNKKAASATQQSEADSAGDNRSESHSQGLPTMPTRPPVPGGAAKKSSSSSKSSGSGAKSAAAKAAAEAKARKDKKGKKR
eukprot:gb/GECG01011867.1/.p1 GENE.gb/GECG01011867.1/~~gb/GECG01011867.1/.p1  ORF type:complete len:286 (+),score=59.16 gb/GECG01011867.1/:1-858(+)